MLIHPPFFTPLSAVPSQPPSVSPRSHNPYSWAHIDLSTQQQCPTAGNSTSCGGDRQEWLPFCTELRWTACVRHTASSLIASWLHSTAPSATPSLIPDPPVFSLQLRLTSSSTVTTQRTTQARIRGSVPARCRTLVFPLECLHRLWDATSRLFNEYSQVISKGSNGRGADQTPHQLARLKESICRAKAGRKKSLI